MARPPEITRPDSPSAAEITVRTILEPGDLGRIVELHGVLYAAEQGFDATFEAYVAEPIARFAIAASPRERVWLAEQEGKLVGCIGVVDAGRDVAQLRWFVVAPAARGAGLGKRLLQAVLDFARTQEYRSILLWTVSRLTVAGHLYRAFGFRKVEEVQASRWGQDVIEERYERELP